jgi:plastocyanin
MTGPSSRFLLIATAAATAALAAGCGSSSSGAGGGGAYGGGGQKTTAAAAATTPAAAPAGATPPGAQALALAAKESGGLSFAPSALKAKAGTVALKLDNPTANALPHAIAIEGNGVARSGQFAQPGGTSSLSVKLKPGTYTFYCPVGNHRAQGMEGTLTVG